MVSTGWGAREWWAVDRQGNLKTRTLGLVSSIAAGLAIALPSRKVIAIDGDGAFLMNLCGLPTIALQSPGNSFYLLFDNEIYEASGGTGHRFAPLDAVAIARAPDYTHASGSTTGSISRRSSYAPGSATSLTLIAVKVDPGQPKDLPPLRLDEIENKYRFIRYWKRARKRNFLNPGFDSKLALLDSQQAAPVLALQRRRAWTRFLIRSSCAAPCRRATTCRRDLGKPSQFH